MGANWTGTDGDCALAYSSVGELFYADTDSPSATTIAVFDAVTGMISRTLVPPATVTAIAGLGVDGTAVLIQQQPTDSRVIQIDAMTGAELPTIDVGFLAAPGLDSGIFSRTFLMSDDNFLNEAFDGTTVDLGSIPYSTEGIGFSGTRLWITDMDTSVINEVLTNDGTTILNSFGFPAAATDICALAAGPAGSNCELCDSDFPYQVCSAATDSVACGISDIRIFAYPAAIGTASQIELLVAGLAERATSAVVPGAMTSAAVACATLTQATALQLVPSGEGDILVYSLASDVATPSNVEVLADALTRAVTLSLDLVEPQILSLSTDPIAATSATDVTVTLTLLLRDGGTGVDLSGIVPSVTGDFTNVGGALTAIANVGFASDALGNVTGTYQFNPSLLGLSVGMSDYIDFTVSAQDFCMNATSVVMADRFIIDNQAPLADDPDPFYPALDVIANGTGGMLWSMTDPTTWTLNEMLRVGLWDQGFTMMNPFTPASMTDVLGGTMALPVIPEASAGDEFNPGIPGALDGWPSGVACVQLFYATGTATATPTLAEFT
ncbi:MAG: hypothetical protein KC917_17700, partial [Candidatus Omnitrophica bacterium]|nr:hypothetical protein [Candidatus Omnitrophota bacterium]